MNREFAIEPAKNLTNLFLRIDKLCSAAGSKAATNAEEPPYVEGSITEFWKRTGVTPIPLTPCKEGEEGFNWSEFINGLGRRTQQKDRSTSS
jgi:hypothetical protein